MGLWNGYFSPVLGGVTSVTKIVFVEQKKTMDPWPVVSLPETNSEFTLERRAFPK